MTTATLRPVRFPWLAVIILAAAAIALPTIVQGSHADKHGSDADAVRGCGNVVQVWLNKTCQRHNIIKSLDNGEYGNHVTQGRKCGLFIEITAYVFRDMSGRSLSFREVQNVMRQKGCVLVWP